MGSETWLSIAVMVALRPTVLLSCSVTFNKLMIDKVRSACVNFEGRGRSIYHGNSMGASLWNYLWNALKNWSRKTLTYMSLHFRLVFKFYSFKDGNSPSVGLRLDQSSSVSRSWDSEWIELFFLESTYIFASIWTVMGINWDHYKCEIFPSTSSCFMIYFSSVGGHT